MHGLVAIAPLPPVPHHDCFTYVVPDALHARIAPGVRVRVPFGRQTRTGVVAGWVDSPPTQELRAVLEVVDEPPFLPSELLELCRWTARYYLASLADVIGTIVPARVPDAATERAVRLVRRLDAPELAALAQRTRARAAALRALHDAPDGTLTTRDAKALGVSDATLRAVVAAGLAEIVTAPRARVPPPPTAPAPRPTLTAEQATAAAALADAIAADTYASFLLHGVTGSGKTEVFLAGADAALAADREVLILVPEIALTHQLVARVRARFGDRVAVLHSGLGPRERWDEWRRIRTRAARVVVGARSAVFAPLARVGLVVVDEEHDAAYKQEDGIRYNARDLAVVRARLAGATVVLASATPSAESWQAAQDGRHRLLALAGRPTGQPLPTVELVDLRDRPRRPGGPELLSDAMRDAVAATLAAGRQALVFLNRRGFAQWLQCPACGAVAECPNCSVTLTVHRRANALVCHHCLHRRRPPDACPQCGGPPAQAFGVGTEQVETALRACFPEAAVDRMDRDAANRPGAQRRILAGWHDGTTDVLVGTQMVAKGHDVPNVTLVAVLLADLSLNLPDFRAAERTFQLLEQVAGRAGRGDAPGRVLVQTFRPGHPSLVAAQAHDYVGFMRGELARRQELGWPPFGRLVSLRLDGTDGAAVAREADALAERLRAEARARGLDADAVRGPAQPPVAKVKRRHRWQLLLRARDVPALRALARSARAAEPALARAHVRLVVDVDPYAM
jgi:primosomal protein N' (replication factor Y)